MKPGEVLYVIPSVGLERPLRLETIAYDGPRGNRVCLTIGEASLELLEGQARQLHLALRKWVRVQKSLRGDTPRGRAKLTAKEVAHAPAAR